MPRWPWSRRAAPAAVVETPQPETPQPETPQPETPQPETSQGRRSVAINSMDYSAKDLELDVVKTERGNFYAIIDDPKNWESPTRSGHWEVRDLVGHMIDVTEGYLTRWDMARRGDPATPLGLLVMAQELDRVALTFRNLPREEAIARLKSSSDRLMTIFDGLTAD